jgi:thioesterase domain-containing protein
MRNLFGALLNGATVCPFDIAGDGLRRIKGWLIAEGITIYFSVPTVFRQFVQTLQGDEEFESLRLIYLGGESVTKEDVQLYKRYFSDTLLVNSLASNEAGIIAYYFIDKHDQLFENSVPAGYPAEGKDLLVLGEDGKNIGVGGIGEIAVRSRFLSPGYWQNQAVTSFALNSDSTDCDMQIYRTGDQGYIRHDGCLIHLGRKGLRVKIRGSRVELEEVEAALRQHPAIREVVAGTAQDQLEGDRLIAYVVFREGQKLSVTDLRDDLTAKFPPYMIPSRFVYLEALPRTPNGKVDRTALPKPDKSRPLLKAAYASPATEDQKLLVEIWSEVLSIDRVGIYDNFFELGGNSLLAAVLLARINREFKKALSISVVYEAPTIDQLAKAVKRKLPMHSWKSLLSLQPEGAKPPFFWIHGQASDTLIGEYLGLDQPVYGLIHQSMDGKPASCITVESIAAHYLREIRTVQSQGPYLLGGYCFGGLIAFEIAQQLKTQNEETSLLFLLDPPDYIAASHSGSAFRARLDPVCALDCAGRPTRDVVYCLTRIKNLIKRRARVMVSLACRVARRIIINGALKCGRPIPVALRSSYIMDVYDDAIRYYCPTFYKGRIIIVKAVEDNRNPETWSHLAGKGAEIHIVPGNHQNILREPYVGAWLEKLKCQLFNTSRIVD